ncbi:MAG: recombinase family protein, partial [Clostridiales Family XIII bacterium]|nr:recombinase family protein [Clostridiales Family XIII bacterium]
RLFAERGLTFDDSELNRKTLSLMLRNPIYVKADLGVYEFFKSQGVEIVNDAADFEGENGCYLYRGRDVATNKNYDLKGHILVLAPHKGRIPSDMWLACRKKLLRNTCLSTTRKAKNTWLAGKVKCGKCGAGLMGNVNSAGAGYFRCRKRADSRSCEGCGTLRVRDVEDFIYGKMRRKMNDFLTLTGKNLAKANPKLTALNVSLVQTENEIEKLINTLTGANATLLSYANSKIEELDAERQRIMKDIADMTAEAVSPEQITRISGYLQDWDNVGFEDRRIVASRLISSVKATSDNVLIEWKI